MSVDSTESGYERCIWTVAKSAKSKRCIKMGVERMERMPETIITETKGLDHSDDNGLVADD